MRVGNVGLVLVWALIIFLLHCSVIFVLNTQADAPFVSPFGAAYRGEEGHFYRKVAKEMRPGKEHNGLPPCTTQIDLSKVTAISWEPRVMLYEGFLEEWECDYLIRLGDEDMQKSTVRNNDGTDMADTDRSSSGAFLTQYEDFVMRSIEERVAKWTQIPAEHGEHMYVLKYEKGQEYKQHFDSFNPAAAEAAGMNVTSAMGPSGARLCTVIMYLRTPLEGGDTRFPVLGFDVSGRRGDALMFWTFTPDMTFDERTLHAGLPVIRGEKFIATVWVREKPFMPRLPLSVLDNTIPYY